MFRRSLPVPGGALSSGSSAGHASRILPPSRIRAVGDPIELQQGRGAPRALDRQLQGVAGHARIVLLEQLQPVADRADRADEFVAQSRGQQFGDAQVDLHGGSLPPSGLRAPEDALAGLSFPGQPDY